jgi:hypothetical protein
MFPDFLNMFREELLDLQEIMTYLSMKTSPAFPPQAPGTLIEVPYFRCLPSFSSLQNDRNLGVLLAPLLPFSFTNSRMIEILVFSKCSVTLLLLLLPPLLFQHVVM